MCSSQQHSRMESLQGVVELDIAQALVEDFLGKMGAARASLRRFMSAVTEAALAAAFESACLSELEAISPATSIFLLMATAWWCRISCAAPLLHQR